MSSPTSENPSVVVVWGDDDFAVKRRARECFHEWTAKNPGADEEILDAGAANSEEALRALARLREALQTLPFFGGTKSIWFRDCNFLGEDRVSEAELVIANLAELGRELAAFRWQGVRLLISAGDIDRRRAIFKTLGKIGWVEHFPGLSADDRDWREKAENIAVTELKSGSKRIDPDALSAFVEQVGANARQLVSEAQKLTAYVGDRPEIRLVDVESVVTRGRHARAFALADAFGDRNLARTLKHLDEEIWSMQSDKQKSEIGLLYGLISKVRAMLMAKELLAEGLLRPAGDYRSFTTQWNTLKAESAGRFPSDRRCSPLELNPYVAFRAAMHSRNFTRDELVRAMEELLKCNRQLVGSGLDGAIVLQLAVVRLLTVTSPRAQSETRPRSQAWQAVKKP